MEIQKMLVRRLQNRVEVLERERDRLVAKQRRLGDQSSAKVYSLEEERDEARQQRDAARVQLRALDGKLKGARARISELEFGTPPR